MSGEEVTILPSDLPSEEGSGLDCCPGLKDKAGFTVIWVSSMAAGQGLSD